jgi:hypothetical protein
MKLTFVMILAVCLVAVFAAGAMAGDYHTGAKLKCYQCHVMHSTKSHIYTGDTHDDNPGGAVTTYDKLLKAEDVNELCLECHNEGDAKDVYGVMTDTTFNRIGGSFNDGATTAYAPFSSELGHDLGTAHTPPGGSSSMTLDCASCHEPHGNAYYRNLNEVSTGVGITYATTTNDTTKDVFQAKIKKFDTSDVSYNLPDSASNHYEQFCVSCHTNVHSDGATGGDWLKHPTVGYAKTYTAGTVSPLKTLGGTPVAGGSGALVAGQVSCVTCHKAHGSSHAFGLIYDNRTTVALEDTDTTTDSIRVTCKHCHDKGLTATE